MSVSTAKSHIEIDQSLFSQSYLKETLLSLDKALSVYEYQGQITALERAGSSLGAPYKHVCDLPATSGTLLGSAEFLRAYNLKYAYMTGAMANGIASADLVIKAAKAGLLGSYGAGGLHPSIIEQDLIKISSALTNESYAVNLIHSPMESMLEKRCVELLFKYDVHVVEASAFMSVNENIVLYRVAGLYHDGDRVCAKNKVIAKISRPEVAVQFASPAPEHILNKLVESGQITKQQAIWAKDIAVADDITVEADSGGHTDRRALTTLFPVIRRLVSQQNEQHQYVTPIRVGAAGSIGTPDAVLAAFSMGADYIVTGSVNQSCVESGSSDKVRKVLANVSIADVDMAPAADMFEMGVQLQVVKKGTLFPMRAKQLYNLYKEYACIEDIPQDVKQKIEKDIFQDTLEGVWDKTKSYFEQRDASQIEKALADPKQKMALIFRSYLGQSSYWANQGLNGREMDYQIWAGSALGAFNDWVAGTELEAIENRHVDVVAKTLMWSGAYLQRLSILKAHGLEVSPSYFNVKSI
ncbi:PfaD family polyunsaturated fatty acid/polyketide biosynthesis protein [Pseudoalteromonas sp. SMS1]|uniref:PfaD family polyunsaturated fatty acid/polyketide biosynthesis protein n=1 Tax=Pseudoalteromonas sp. SMS1 TaxID=2908894 RepID=UPI001F016C4E|nr:PfaD family polyunsaturated fatty acid/polyketide biosynthesis protein [Pseudoalteromonas sp. SMS1]MCF2858938.1 PfaD family polyunsaturated fatty acid/polyketide biosynthesis protein [Pseudoalteromonas sp. SMS1]